MASGNFKLYSQYYDLIYKDKDYQAETDYICELIEKYASIQGNSLLDLGSGTGKHGQLLAKKGFRVTGIERSPEMVAIGNKQSNTNFVSYIGDITNFSLDNRFEVVTSLFHVVSYIGSNDDLSMLFENVHRHLKSDGLFIFDVWYSPAVYTLKPETRVKRIKSEKFELTRIAEPVIHYKKNMIDVKYHIFLKNLTTNKIDEIKEIHPMRHFSIPEIQMYAEKHNYDLIKSEEWLTGYNPSSKTWGVNFILRKK
jgi:SAM-dependent methyltransferase